MSLVIIVISGVFQWMLLRVNMSRYPGKRRLFEMMDDGQDNSLPRAADQYRKEEVVLDCGLDKILSQPPNMFELGAPSLVMAGRFRTQTNW